MLVSIVHRKYDQLRQILAKVRKMPMNRFPKQTPTMLENDLDLYTSTSTSNWAGNFKHCLESHGFQDVLTNGAADETSFISLFKRKMVERFQEEWHTKIFNSDRFATHRLFKSIHGAEKYLNDIGNEQKIPGCFSKTALCNQRNKVKRTL